MAKRSCGMRGLPMCGATVVAKGDGNLDSTAGEWGGIISGFSVAPLTTGPLVGLWAASGCSPTLPDGTIAKTPTPNPATIKPTPVTLLMTNRTLSASQGAAR